MRRETASKSTNPLIKERQTRFHAKWDGPRELPGSYKNEGCTQSVIPKERKQLGYQRSPKPSGHLWGLNRVAHRGVTICAGAVVLGSCDQVGLSALQKERKALQCMVIVIVYEPWTRNYTSSPEIGFNPPKLDDGLCSFALRQTGKEQIGKE